MENVPEIIRKFELSNVEAAKRELHRCNDFSSRFNLVLSDSDINELTECRQAALKSSGRIELGEGILPKLIRAFCDSPYVMQSNYADTLAQLQDAFYNFKNESSDRIFDDELIEMMSSVFNGRSQGDGEYLSSLSVEALIHFADKPYDAADADDADELF